MTVVATIQISEQTLVQLKANAAARGMSLDAYLQSLAAADAALATGLKSGQLAAIESFANGMGTWVRQHVPVGHVVNDSRESIYPDPD